MEGTTEKSLILRFTEADAMKLYDVVVMNDRTGTGAFISELEMILLRFQDIEIRQ